MTKAQWQEMWYNTNRLDDWAKELEVANTKTKLIIKEIETLKRLIQSEIGQME